MKFLIVLTLLSSSVFAQNITMSKSTLLLPTTKKKAEIVATGEIVFNKMNRKTPKYFQERCSESADIINQRLAVNGISSLAETKVEMNYSNVVLPRKKNITSGHDDYRLERTEFYTEYGCRLSVDLESNKDQFILMPLGNGRNRLARKVANELYGIDSNIAILIKAAPGKDSYVLGNKVELFLLKAIK